MNSVLIVGAQKTKKVSLLKHFLGDSDINYPQHSSSSGHSGIIQPWKLITKYYSVDLNFWIDEISNHGEQGLKMWVQEFNSVSDELEDVLQVFIYTFDPSIGIEMVKSNVELLNQIGIIGNLEVIGVGTKRIKDIEESLEDLFFESGFELVYYDDIGENEYKEKLGKERILEVLQCHEWKQSSAVISNDKNRANNNNNDNDNDNSNNANDNIALLANELDLDQLLKKINQIKDKVSGIPNEDERHELIKSSVEELMDDLKI